MGMLSAKFNDDDSRKLAEICEVLGVEKSEALRRATQQLWLSLQIDKPFVERAGGRPKHLLNSGKANASERIERKGDLASHLDERAARRRKPKTDSK